MKLAVIGSGYVGLITGVAFASRGHHVVCVDMDQQRVDSLRAGVLPFYEPDLQPLLDDASRKGQISFTADLQQAVSDAKIAFIAVGTPPREDGSADISQVLAVSDALSTTLPSQSVVVVRSTVPVGTADLVRKHVNAGRSEQVRVISNPEFLREGKALHDFLNPDRVVIGTDNPEDAALMNQLYEVITTPEHIVVTSSRSAEMAKYACNAFLATKISFINEIADLCFELDADVTAVRNVMGRDPRIGSSYLSAGLGFGGSCLPKDTLALVDMATAAGTDANVLSGAFKTNSQRPQVLVKRIKRELGGLSGKHLSVWGLAFKPETDDLRFAQSIALIEQLLAEGAEVTAYDPEVKSVALQAPTDSFSCADDKYGAVKNADVLVLATEWDEFMGADWTLVRQAMRGNLVFDGRNVLDADVLEKSGLKLVSMGAAI